jgi:hypothetical protein
MKLLVAVREGGMTNVDWFPLRFFQRMMIACGSEKIHLRHPLIAFSLGVEASSTRSISHALLPKILAQPQANRLCVACRNFTKSIAALEGKLKFNQPILHLHHH